MTGAAGVSALERAVVRARRAFPALLLLAASCAGLELESEPPDGFDLNGTWRLVENLSDTPPAQRRLRARGGLLAFVTQDFPVLRARTLTIEQSRDSMGIRYDGGDYRDVSWGERRRGLWEVRAGWNEGRLFILWDAADADAREILTLAPDGGRLTVDIRIASGGDDVEATRVFERR